MDEAMTTLLEDKNCKETAQNAVTNLLESEKFNYSVGKNRGKPRCLLPNQWIYRLINGHIRKMKPEVDLGLLLQEHQTSISKPSTTPIWNVVSSRVKTELNIRYHNANKNNETNRENNQNL